MNITKTQIDGGIQKSHQDEKNNDFALILASRNRD